VSIRAVAAAAPLIAGSPAPIRKLTLTETKQDVKSIIMAISGENVPRSDSAPVPGPNVERNNLIAKTNRHFFPEPPFVNEIGGIPPGSIISSYSALVKAIRDPQLPGQ
jgi:hypothetical protein